MVKESKEELNYEIYQPGDKKDWMNKSEKKND